MKIAGNGAINLGEIWKVSLKLFIYFSNNKEHYKIIHRILSENQLGS